MSTLEGFGVNRFLVARHRARRHDEAPEKATVRIASGAPIGMVQMFANMTDPSKLGPFMAVALLAPSTATAPTWSAKFSKRRACLRPTSTAWRARPTPIRCSITPIVVRQILEAEGMPSANFYAVAGKADTDPLFPDDPFIAANRRVTITLMREAPRSRRISSPRRP